MPLCASIVIHDDHAFLAPTLASVASIPRLVFVSRLDWTGKEGDWRESVRIAEAAGATVILGDWADGDSHRVDAYAHALAQGFTHMLVLDSDEVVEPELLGHLHRIAEAELADRVYVEWDTYWKSPEYVIRPRERFTPCFMIDLRVARHVHIRTFEGGRALLLNDTYGIVHHLSYAGGDARIAKKTTTWDHRDEVLPGWWHHRWRAWDGDRLLRDLHPTHPPAYGFAERIPVPAVLEGLETSPPPDPVAPYAGRISVVIPACNGQDDLDRCLASLAACAGFDLETIVVDNGSAPPIYVPEGVTLLRNEANEGFAAASNTGARLATGDVVLFLNSDTVVPAAGLARLMEALHASGTIAAAGPWTNNALWFQKLEPTYTDVAHLDLFAEEFAHRAAEDVDSDMLVGFCMAVRKRVLDEIGLFDERFGLGTFEDNDLSYRLRRAGYRLVIAGRAYVHHEGSKTMRRLAVEEAAAPLDLGDLLETNRRKFLAKWREDLESGFASDVSGLAGGPIFFDVARRPENRLGLIRELARRADVSLCMIVRNEERVLGDCLASASPFFREVRVLDTGSTDRTVAIARAHGAIVEETEWPQSFALARTASMREALGQWIMWLDADDTLPTACGETILRAVIEAEPDVVGFVVPVRFVEEHGRGTEVDHVKVFRNLPGLEWEGRIHEQILPALREAMPEGRLVRLEAHVLHSGYDTSPEGQARKSERDRVLLALDLDERPGHPFVLFNLGMTAHYGGDHEEAVDWMRRSIAAAREGESHLRKAYALMAASLRALGRHVEAEGELKRGISTVPGDPEILFGLARLAADDGDHTRAVALYEEVLSADVSGAFTSLDPGILSYKTLHNLALSRLSLGDWAGASHTWEQALKIGGRVEIAKAMLDGALEAGDLNFVRSTIEWAAKQDANLKQEMIQVIIANLMR